MVSSWLTSNLVAEYRALLCEERIHGCEVACEVRKGHMGKLSIHQKLWDETARREAFDRFEMPAE
jgi:hypothetical protein